MEKSLSDLIPNFLSLYIALNPILVFKMSNFNNWGKN